MIYYCKKYDCHDVNESTHGTPSKLKVCSVLIHDELNGDILPLRTSWYSVYSTNIMVKCGLGSFIGPGSCPTAYVHFHIMWVVSPSFSVYQLSIVESASIVLARQQPFFSSIFPSQDSKWSRPPHEVRDFWAQARPCKTQIIPLRSRWRNRQKICNPPHNVICYFGMWFEQCQSA
jgi:hypothetical protein